MTLYLETLLSILYIEIKITNSYAQREKAFPYLYAKSALGLGVVVSYSLSA
jgi:hypothetical protein